MANCTKRNCFSIPMYRILDFSPSRIMLRKLKIKYPNYLSSDYQNNALVDRQYDITNIPEPDNSLTGLYVITYWNILKMT
ncbi:MAG: hypothetical protein HC906_15145 [Bacteroidales bacterium]|nr:hypothetical protein [Bacteroidales bacterium]